MKQQTTLPLDQNVADKIHALLARCDQLRRSADIARPTYFNRSGEQHTRSVAAKDRQRDRSTMKTHWSDG